MPRERKLLLARSGLQRCFGQLLLCNRQSQSHTKLSIHLAQASACTSVEGQLIQAGLKLQGELRLLLISFTILGPGGQLGLVLLRTRTKAQESKWKHNTLLQAQPKLTPYVFCPFPFAESSHITKPKVKGQRNIFCCIERTAEPFGKDIDTGKGKELGPIMQSTKGMSPTALHG